MSLLNMDNDRLLKEIESAFPFVEMPDAQDLTFHQAGCHECEDLRKDIEDYRGKEITGQVIRFFHQEMSLLSAKAWQWILPHYLRFCLTPEALYDTAATQFLIYNLGPELQFQKDTLQRLSGFNQTQIDCLIHFLDWCLSQQYWKDYCPDAIERGMNFLLTIKAKL
jgi:hypothetical protein